jgi:hypothetical protein
MPKCHHNKSIRQCSDEVEAGSELESSEDDLAASKFSVCECSLSAFSLIVGICGGWVILLKLVSALEYGS